MVWPLELLSALLIAATTMAFTGPAMVLFTISPFHRHSTGFLRLWSRFLLFYVFAKVEVRGEENLKGVKGAIFLSNHQSYYDIPAILAATPISLRMVAKKELFRIPFLGWAMAAARFISIDRSNHKNAVQSLEIASRRIRAGLAVLLFPEGTRSRSAVMGPFKKGAFALALQAGMPIQPVAVKGSIDVHDRTRPWRLSYFRKIRVEFLPPVDPNAYGPERRQELMDEVRRRIEESLQRP